MGISSDCFCRVSRFLITFFIEIHLQDLVLGEFTFDLARAEGLEDLAAESLPARGEHHLGQLLGDGAAALGLA